MAKAIDWKLLAAPFEENDIEWRALRSGMKNDKGWASVVAYVTNRAIMQRLDDVIGPDGWKNEYSKAPDDGVLCGISIKVGDEWITKYDGAENTDIEAVKGGLSTSMKRAAVQWGIGRFLYGLDSTFVQVDSTGDNYIKIKVKDKPDFTGYWNAPKLPAGWALAPATPTTDEVSPTGLYADLAEALKKHHYTKDTAKSLYLTVLDKEKPETVKDVKEVIAALEVNE